MNDAEKQIVEQVAGATLASCEMMARLLIRLVNLKKLDAGEAVLILGDMVGHHRDLARRNAHLPGTAHVYGLVADRLQVHLDAFEQAAGASVETTGRPPK